MLAVGAAQVRVVDASREAARALARGDDASTAEAVALRIAPDGARLEGCARDGDDVTVEVSVAGPRVPSRDVRVSAEARAGPG